MTGNWEMRLNNIALGKENPAQFIADISQTTREWFAAVAGAPEQHFGTAAQLEFSCPHCGKPLTRLATVCKCSAYSKDESACHFHMSTYICGQRLHDDVIQKLLNKGRSGLIKGFKAKAQVNVNTAALNGHSFWDGTQAEYDALETYDPKKWYGVYEDTQS